MLRFGLFGAGRIGRGHAASLAAHPRTELAVVHDPVEVAAHEIAALYGATPTGDAGAILGDPGIDAVIIASPTPTHLDLRTACAQAGKAVLCEKPIDLDLARVDACWEDIKGLNATVMVGFNRRFDPTFAEMQERVAGGEIGRLEQLLITSRDPAPAPAAYIASSGGLFRDMTIHDLDMARFFLGEVVEVQAFGANLIEPYIAEAGDVDSAVVSMRGADGELCQITNSRRCAFGYDQRVEAFGADGMLSAAADAEDLVQETYLRAWRSYEGFEGRASVRTWLYRIATNACLTALERRGRRPLPSGLGGPAGGPEAPMVAGPEVPWLRPLPDALLAGDYEDPASVAVSREGIRLAFVAALQYLSARQRAVLIMRDVLQWPAAEVAELLGMTTTAVNSGLRRARAQLAQALRAEDELAERAGPGRRALLDRFAAAFENADVSGLAELLREHVTPDVPPRLTWSAGRADAARVLAPAPVFASPG